MSQESKTGKTYSEMTPAERLADRIAKNREIDARVTVTIAEKSQKKSDPKRPSEIATRQVAVKGALDKFQQIKKAQGIDAASDYILSKIKK